jgi:hypothetical protein
MTLDDILNKKERFSKYSIAEEFNLDDKAVKSLCDEAFKDPRVTTYYMIECSQCHNIVREGLLLEFPKDSMKCGKCRKSFKVKDKDVHLIYDPISPLTRLKKG